MLCVYGGLKWPHLEKIGECSPAFFERLVVDLLVGMGYGGSRRDAGQSIGRSGDGGVDGIIKEDKLGLDAVYVQAKRWGRSVGRPEVQGFAGSLEGFRARKGVMITTSTFTTEAHTYVSHIEKRIVLIDGPMIANLMLDYNVGVTTANSYTLQRLDLDYFEEE
jgi:restriction system protein